MTKYLLFFLATVKGEMLMGLIRGRGGGEERGEMVSEMLVKLAKQSDAG